MKLKLNTQKGFSLLELLLVVAVGAILILAGLAIYRNVTLQTQVNEASRLVNVLKQETQKLWQGEGVYGAAGDNLEATLISANAVPSAYVESPTSVVSPTGGEVDVLVATNPRNFTITFPDVPTDICINLGRLYTANDPDFESVTINDTAQTAPDVASVTTACSDSDSNTLLWEFN